MKITFITAFRAAVLHFSAPALLTVQVVVAPHIYPPSISKATSDYEGTSLFNRLTLSFGSLNKAGYCLSDGTCHQFAIAIGETGTAFTNALDTPSMADFANYLTNTGKAVQSASATGV